MKSKRNFYQSLYKLFCTIFISVFLLNALNAATNIPAGNVSGIWNLAGSPYLIEGDITVPLDSSLIIDPGVVVEFQSWYRLIVFGDLQAIGTPTQLIVFTATPPGPGEPAWPGIDIMDAPVPSNLEYCVIENGQSRGAEPNDRGGAIYILNSSPVIKNSTLRNNESSRYGGAIYCDGGNPVIEGCTITNNSSRYGGGLYFTNYSQPQIVGNTISHNSASAYGSFSPVTSSGGGIHLYHTDALIDNNIISYNTVHAEGNVGTHARGGAIYIQFSDPVLTGNTIYGNEATLYSSQYEGGALFLYGSDVITINNIFWNNSPQAAFFSTSGTSNMLVAYSDVENGQANIATNGNGTLYWMEGNITSDPSFTDATMDDFSLQAGSPVIDAGTDYYEVLGIVRVDLDPSEYIGSAPDMGALEAGDSGGANQSPVAHASASPDHGSSPLTVQFSSTGSYDPDGTIVSYNWDFGDGATSTELNPEHTFTGVDQYAASLTVTDNDGATHSNAIVINVQNGTTLTGGEVSGTWTLAGSPYRVEGDLTIPSGQTLVIEPGVTIEFISWYGITINGTILANGTESEPILFTSNAVPLWHGLDFINSDDGSILEYCIIEKGQSRGAAPNDKGGALYLVNSDPTVRNCVIQDNDVSDYGGAIYMDASSPVIENSQIINNSAKFGGGIYATNNSQPFIYGNNISNNSVSAFGGFGPATSYGGGIGLNNSDARIEKNIINFNTVHTEGNVPSYSRGGAIYVYNSDPQLVGNTIYGNNVSGVNPEGGAIFVYYSTVVSVNNIMWNNAPWEVSLYSLGTIIVAHSDVEGGEAGIVIDDGTINWLTGNITNDPQFVNANSGNFELLETSPAVNAGTDYFEWSGSVIADIDPSEYIGSAPDMGALESSYTTTVNIPPVAVAAASVLTGDAPLTVQFNPDGSSDPDGTITGYNWSIEGTNSGVANPEYTFTTPGTYLVSLEVTDNDGATDNDEITIEVTDASLDELHVGGMMVTYQRVTSRYYRGIAYVLVHDQNHQPVVNATVTGDFSGPSDGTFSNTTDQSGIAILYANLVWRPTEGWCFDVTDVSLSGYEYHAADNYVTYLCNGPAVIEESLQNAITEELIIDENIIAEGISIYPNPFSEHVNIQFSLNESAPVYISIFDMTGKTIKTLVNASELPAGTHEYSWDGFSETGQKIDAGVYYVRIIKGKESQTYKLLLVN